MVTTVEFLGSELCKISCQSGSTKQACAIESAAKWNPNRTILVTFTSKVGYSLNSSVSPIIAALNAYPNIYFRNVDLTRYSIQTPMEHWFQNDQLFLSQYLNSHTSDFLRYASMFKFGGIYLDLDVVVQRNFNELPSNFAAAESVRFVAVGAMGFQPNGIGHAIAELCVKEFSSSFNGFKWAHNGPGILTRVLKKICQAQLTSDMTPEKCLRFNVLPQNTFYAIKSKQWQMFFNPNATQETLRLTRNSVLVHVWNKYSASQIIRKRRKKTAYDVIASINCPKVYQASGNSF
ncbi:lactosylceramide 4-alpha-galactosyltransferase-like [Contarinia nasturtii]|uniref:lactosylceramide 4-alpha-galactosyltransferase-like n=1 Tax=Contarinia nasturtii TaxID=265458 RepID=UPI0012D46B02|nr:lactosylceramide 4-alpha-galactosyltransferase-like [Contarinia nasturtii]